MLTIYRRHASGCQHFGKSRNARAVRGCDCAIWVQGSLRGEYIRKALDLRSWEAAADLVRGWDASGEIGVVKPEIPTVREAVGHFLDDAKARHLSHETIRKYENLFEKRSLPWCEGRGYRLLKQLTVSTLREFRNSWEDGPAYATKNLERLKAFFGFCQPWLKDNPARALKAPKVEDNPTLPFCDGEMKRILEACGRYRGDRDRIRAFVLVMRYSGLRISDTISLRLDQVKDGRIQLYTAKTGTPVWVPVPAIVVDALGKFEPAGDRYFWNVNGKLTTRVSNWSRYLSSVFKLAKIDGGHSHRFRDTFATSLLQSGCPVEDVAALLGNSPKIVTKHYAPWIRERQIRLEERVKAAWAS